MRIQRIILSLIVLITAFSAYEFISSRSGVSHCNEPYFFKQGYSPDAFEYQMPAANLALHNCFPYYGFMSSMSDYHLCAAPDSVAYFRDTREAGSMVFVSKPPLYPLLLGIVYKLTSFEPWTAVYFNLISLVLLAALMPLAGLLLGRYVGLIAGIASAIILLLTRNYKLWSFTAETLTALLVMVVFILGIMAVRKRKPGSYFLFGVSLSLLILCKGYFAISIGLFSAYLSWRIFTDKSISDLKSLLYFNLGAASFIILWMLYINPLLQSNIPDRLSFHKKLKATTPQVILNDRNGGFDRTGNVRSDVVDNLNKFHQYQHAKENGLVIITNQLGDYNILNVHNEYCTDGDFHPEWRIISSSFFNQHSALTKHQKLWHFYTENPRLGVQITWAKLVSATHAPGNFMFYVSLLLALCLLIARRFDEMMIPGVVLLVNIFFVLIILYGDTRFIETVYPIALILSMLSIRQLLCGHYISGLLSRTENL